MMPPWYKRLVAWLCQKIGHVCRLASKIELDPVTGRMCFTAVKVQCWKEREDGSCGPEGRNFEKKRGIFSLLFGTCR